MVYLATLLSTVSRFAFRAFASVALAMAMSLAIVGRAAADNVFPPPVVVVYPFTVAGDSSAGAVQTGGNIALLLSNRLAELGGIVVKPFTPGTTRADYLTAAEKQNADYYVTGYLTPIGAEISLITQVVSTYGGTVVWSSTVTVRTYGDALGQADPLRSEILAHAERSFSAITAQAPTAATPEPVTRDAAGVNLTKALGRHHRDASPSPAPSGSPAAVAVAVAITPRPIAPPNVALVASVSGTGDPALNSYAANSLVAALRRAGATGAGALAIGAHDAVAHAADLCKANTGARSIYVATLGVAAAPAPAAVTLDVTAYDCSGKPLGAHGDSEQLGRRDTDQKAIDRAAAKTIDAFLKTTALQ